MSAADPVVFFVPPDRAFHCIFLELIAVGGLVPDGAFAVLTVGENGATVVCLAVVFVVWYAK